MKDQTDDKNEKAPRQFSLRALFGLTFAAVILMAVVFRNSPGFHALWSLYSLIAVLPILVVFVVDTTALINGRRLAIISLVIFGVALATPALRLASDLVFGILAFLLSFVGIILFGDWGPRGEQFWYPIACTMGAVANVSFLVGWVAFLSFVRWRKGIVLARRSSTLGSFLSLTVILPLALSGELNGVYPGYGLWAASLLALALGSWRAEVSTQS
ncbi:MAG: hypothetical protein ABL888_17090 [Pirellulaceae bacterium]